MFSNPELVWHLVIVIGSILSVWIARVRTKTYFTAAFCYSSGWTLLMVAHNYLKVFPDTFEIPDESFIITAKVAGAGFIGVIAAHLCFGRYRTQYEEMRVRYSGLEPFIQKYYYWVIGAVFLVGFCAFIQRFSMVGFSIFSLMDLRQMHVSTVLSLFQRIAVYVSFFWFVFLILSAVSDVFNNRVNIWRLVLGIGAILPLALSKGSRGELLAPVITYGITMLVVLAIRSATARSGAIGVKWGLFKRLGLRLLPLILFLLVFVTVYGQLRQVGSKEYGGRYEIFGPAEALVDSSLQITSYWVSSLHSAGPITRWIEYNEPRTNGRQYFEALYKVPEKIGLVPNYGVQQYYARQDAYKAFGTAAIAFTPGTMAKKLTREVGLSLAPIAAFLVMFLTVGVTILVRCYNFFGLALVVAFMRDAFLSFQTVHGFGMSNVWLFVAAALVYYVFKSKYQVRMR